MKFKGFSKWVELREQAPAPAGAMPAAMKDDSKQIDTQIKQVMANNISKPKKMRDTALGALAKKMAMDPNVKPDQLKKVQDAIGADDVQPGQPQK